MMQRPHKILYVEDNPLNRELVRRVLTQAGYEVLEAEDGLAGIQIAEKEHPDLILMDIMLPAMDGLQVTTRLKSLPDMADTPIVALTAKLTDDDRNRALVAGCDGYITKPFDVDRLPVQIAEFLKGKREEINGDAEVRLSLQQEYTQELVIDLEHKIRELQRVNSELRHTDELKSKFISMASHELRTPLAVIQGYLQILQTALGEMENIRDETTYLSLQGIQSGVERLRAIVDDMLDVVRIEGKTIVTHREPTVMREVVRAAVRRLEPAARERNLGMHAQSMRDLPTVMADPDRLNQVFFNLIGNAIKYTPDGGRIDIWSKVVSGIEVRRWGYAAGESGRYVHIVIQDTGIGIEPRDHERIFDLFYEVRDVSLHSTSKTRFMGSGLGLGLNIARGIVKAHGGFLWAESEGHDRERCPGSRFHVLLPVED
jgi:signal transduction histidine kinase